MMSLNPIPGLGKSLTSKIHFFKSSGVIVTSPFRFPDFIKIDRAWDVNPLYRFR